MKHVVRKMQISGKDRRTLRMIKQYPEPKEILAKILDPETDWPYSTDPERERKTQLYLARDRALAAVLYNGELRISEAERLVKSQFKDKPFRIVAVQLSKAEKHMRNMRNQNGDLVPIPEGHPNYGKVLTRKDLYRKEIRLPSKGYRGQISELIKQYLDMLTDDKDFETIPIFNIDNTRVDQIVKRKLGVPPHWLRAFGENELYGLWDYDLIAVANYVQVDPRTLSKYIHRVPEKYLDRE
jgi:hypothetical protein